MPRKLTKTQLILIAIIFSLLIGIIGMNNMNNNTNSASSIIFIETNSNLEQQDYFELDIAEQVKIIESEIIILESELPFAESELPFAESELPFDDEETIPTWLIPESVNVVVQPLIEPIQELIKITNPHEPKRISNLDITLNPMMLDSGYYSVFNHNPDQAINGVFWLHIDDYFPIIIKDIHIRANSNYPMNTPLFVGGCGHIGDGDPIFPCKKKYVMAFYDSKLPKNSPSLSSLLNPSTWTPLNQCVGLVDGFGNISNKCKNGIFQSITGTFVETYKSQERWK
jgi:hypothetical protein